MSPQTHPGLRIGALASSVLLVSGLIAYRTGFLTAESVVDPGGNGPAGQSMTSKPPSLELTDGEVSDSQFSDASVASMPPVSELLPTPESAAKKLADLSKPVINTQLPAGPVTVMAGSKSVVLVDARQVKEKAKADLFFAERDRNRDGKLTRDEVDQETWKDFQHRNLVENDAVALVVYRMNAAEQAMQSNPNPQSGH